MSGPYDVSVTSRVNGAVHEMLTDVMFSVTLRSLTDDKGPIVTMRGVLGMKIMEPELHTPSLCLICMQIAR